ncbi:MAG: tRNA lysidine(34) synthetase TilS, partial [Ruminiclostridium sp.]|nr:tRNA lysidine(34) synthetase TilS [Ruminiclostridium sp.]
MSWQVVQEMLDKVVETIKRYKLIENGDKIVAGVSGGPDSVCLLHVLNILSGKMDIKVLAIHINHKLRGFESDADEAFTQEICRKMGINLRSLAFDISELSGKEGISLEEAGRETRYREFQRFADETGAAKIAVAHNKNDQAETILMNLFRGTGLQGLTGMDYMYGRIIRPLLSISRHEIETYCKDNSLGFRVDSSNLKGDFTRNRIRLDLIPEINKNFNTDLTEAMHRMALLLKNDNNYLEADAQKAFNTCLDKFANGCVRLKLKELKLLHPALAGRVFRIAVSCIKGDLKGIESKHIEDITELVDKNRTGSSIQLPKGIRAGISYSVLKIYIEKAVAKSDFDYELAVPGFAYFDEVMASVETSIDSLCPNIDKYERIGYNSLEQFFDYDRIKEGINIRNRRVGDIFTPYRS